MELKPRKQPGPDEIAASTDDSTLTQAMPEVNPVSRAGKYRITGRIGQGGMGVVYRAIDDDLGRTVALKFIPPEMAIDSTTEQRFLREARAASALDHPNIGTIFGVEETSDRRRFIVMAYYEGRNLSQRMHDESNPLTPREAIGIGVQVAGGLAEAHARGVIHRDIKPSNILLTVQGLVKIVDFGLAAMSGADQLSHTGASMGTPAYMSPEQALGADVDHRSDIWSLGVVTCEMLTRQKVFRGGSAVALMYQVVHENAAALDALAPEPRAVLAKALMKDPAQRYQSMSEFREALTSLQSGSPGMSFAMSFATAVQAPDIAGPYGWKMPRSRVLLLMVVLLAIAGGVAAVIRMEAHAGAKKAAVASRPVSSAPAAASVFDGYQKAVELTKRWDKDGNLEQAIALLTDATKQDPGFALGFAHLAEAQRIRSSLTGDKALLDAAFGNAEQSARLNGDLSPVYVILGRIQAMRGSSDLALASYEHALRIDANDAEAHESIARQYGREGRKKDAEASYKEAIALDPDNISMHDSYANFLFREVRYPEAIREWQTVVRLAPDDAPAYINLGSALNESGQIAEAITMFQRAVQIKPNYMAYTNLGTAFYLSGHFPQAADVYRKALDLNSKDYLVWGNLAYVYDLMKGESVRANQTFAKAIAMAEAKRKETPRDDFVNTDLAAYYARTGNSQLALTRLNTALALAPKSPEVQAAAAEVYEVLGQRAKAVGFVRGALALGYPRQRLQRNPALLKLLKSIQ
jgi:serine/threonine-protein kinase